MSTLSRLPSKKVLGFGVLSILILIGAISVRSWQKSPSGSAVISYSRTDSSADSANPPEPVSFVPSRPTVDWQTALNNAIPDGTASSSALTSTDRFARELFEQYALMKKGGTLSLESEAALAATLVDSLDSKRPTPHRYTAKDLRISQNDSKDAYAVYHNALNSAIGNYSYKELGSELDLVERMIKTNTDTVHNSLEKARIAYDHITEGLLVVTVPKSLTELHLLFVNGFASLSASTATFEIALEDPLAATLALQTYHESSQAILGALALKI